MAIHLPDGTTINTAETTAIYGVICHAAQQKYRSVLIYTDSASSGQGMGEFIREPWACFHESKYDIMRRTVTVIVALAHGIRVRVQKVKSMALRVGDLSPYTGLE